VSDDAIGCTILTLSSRATRFTTPRGGESRTRDRPEAPAARGPVIGVAAGRLAMGRRLLLSWIADPQGPGNVAWWATCEGAPARSKRKLLLS
jgi:hypothetical protein